MEINSNSRNKPTANWISNKNAIASNNVSFLSNVVRCFHWLLKNSLPSPRWACLFFFWDILFVVFILLLFPPLSTVSGMTCDLQVNQSQPEYSTRREVCVWGSKEENLIRDFSTALLKINADALLFLHHSCIRLVCICCLWRVDIAVQCCQFSVFSKMLQWFREEENIQSGHILAGHASGEFADGGSDSVQCYEA